ncbi:endothelin-converting enzyme 2-like [Haemaphysalis longicornis]
MSDRSAALARKRTLSRARIGCVLCVFLVLAAAMMAILVTYIRKPQYVDEPRFCETEECAEHARRILRTMNSSADPCVSLHRYVCGNGDAANRGQGASFLGRQGILDERSSAGVSISASASTWRFHHTYIQEMVKTFGNPEKLSRLNQSSEATAKSMEALRLCLNRGGNKHGRPFVALMKDLQVPLLAMKPQAHGVKLVDVLGVLLNLTINWRLSLWFEAGVWSLDSRPKTGPVVVFDEPGHVPLLRMEELSTLDDASYSDAVRKTARLLAANEEPSSSGAQPDPSMEDTWVEELRSDESAFRRIILSTLGGDESQDRVIPLHEIRTALRLMISFEEGIVLLKIFEVVGINITVQTKVLLLNNPLYTELMRLFRETPPPRLMRVLSWTFAYSYAWIADPDMDIFPRKDSWPDTDAAATASAASRNAPSRDVLCFAAVHESFGLAPVASLFHQHFPDEQRRKVDSVLNDTTRYLIEALGASQALANSTKVDAYIKIHSPIFDTLWPPKPFLSLGDLDRLYAPFRDVHGEHFFNFWLESRKALSATLPSRYYGTLMTARLTWYAEKIRYVYSLNHIFLGLAAIFPPTYFRGGSSVMTYAGLGFQLARQLAKSVDSRGRLLDASGRPTEWWHQHGMCRINTAHSMEDGAKIRDVLALDVALETMKGVSGRQPRRLKLLDNLTPEQTFYVSYCSHFCGTHCAKDMCDLAKNSSRFSDAFGCQPRNRGCLLF